MADARLKNLSVEELNALIAEASRIKKELVEGVPTNSQPVIKMAHEIDDLAAQLKVDPAKVVTAIGRMLKVPVQFRAYAPVDPNKPRKPRAKK